jgi:hypothetical protein
MRRFLQSSLLVLLSACASRSGEPALSATSSAVVQAAGGEAHLLLTVSLSPTESKVLDARRVSEPLPLLRGRASGSWRVDLEDASGRVLHTAMLPAANEFRAELAGADGGMDSMHHQNLTAVFAVRLPILAGATVIRCFAPAGTLAADDPRGRAHAAEELIEIGRLAWPVVTQ